MSVLYVGTCKRTAGLIVPKGWLLGLGNTELNVNLNKKTRVVGLEGITACKHIADASSTCVWLGLEVSKV